jgi:hypothetical protein
MCLCGSVQVCVPKLAFGLLPMTAFQVELFGRAHCHEGVSKSDVPHQIFALYLQRLKT